MSIKSDCKPSKTDGTSTDAFKDDFFEAEEILEEQCEEIITKTTPEPSGGNQECSETKSKDTVDYIEEAMNQSDTADCNKANSCKDPIETVSENETSSQRTKKKKSKPLPNNRLRSRSEISILASALKRKQREFEALAARCYQELAYAQDEIDEIREENEELIDENETLKDLLEYILTEAAE